MEAQKSDWYKYGWTLDIKNQSWVEDTDNQVEFIIKAMGLKGHERILDLACGYGRHSLAFARRGYEVVGVDITHVYVGDGNRQAALEQLPAVFIESDIRDVSYDNEFDVVINMGDGAIGYLENEEENLKIFDVIAKALKPGGKHFMDIMSADYADAHFPCQLWDAGLKGLTISKFEWDKTTSIMLYGQNDFEYGKELPVPVFDKGNPTRLYHAYEADDIMKNRGMKTVAKYGRFDGTPASSDEIQMMVYSVKS